ncbi:hypothetical protein GGR27_003780 [Lewinella antarctica]|uniref:Uncharacterized protein n=1 Tax=Neolewinella antarctica TaxID=442734 RepID=A0ABX0XHF3_9BACT|nr:hypothetical protein [Neolewinella antarctica]
MFWCLEGVKKSVLFEPPQTMYQEHELMLPISEILKHELEGEFTDFSPPSAKTLISQAQRTRILLLFFRKGGQDGQK